LSESRYKAYISYSHEDARWAAWLHRALESYRVPRRLVGSAGAAGEVPARLSPIFRDRDDLSTSHSLDSDLATALEESEALIVVCSPAAAASRWVNEEIRRFKALGRSERVFCMIVDGDPEAAVDRGGAFPPALFEGVAEGGEPLAADARDFADGKRLARQKMVAGLLGVRLDEIRQRDLKRRRRWRLIGGAAATAVLVLAVVAWQSAVAERQERAKAEQMAGFLVGLVDDLSSELDLESLSRMSAKALEYWQDLDVEKLSPETRVKVGQVLRQIGRVTEQQGRYDEALDYLLRSRDLFRGLQRERPQLDEALFELGQAEFWVAYFHYNRGDMPAAWPGLREYDRISRELYSSDPDNERWLLEFSYAVTGILALKILSGEPLGPEILAEADEALQIAERALEGNERDTERLSNYSTTVAWASDAHDKACELDKVVELRRERLELTERTLEEDPSDNEVRQQVAYAHTGLGRVMLQTGRMRESERHFRQAVRILRDQAVQDESNQRLWQEWLMRQTLLADTLIQEGQGEQAGVLLDEIESEAVDRYPEGVDNPAHVRDTIERLLTRAHWYRDRLRADEARMSLRAARSLSDRLGPLAQQGAGDHARRVDIEYWLWRLSDGAETDNGGLPGLRRPRPAGAIRSCQEALADTQLAIMEGDPTAYSAEIDWLRGRGYAAPRFEELVRHQGLWDPVASVPPL